MGPTSGYQPQVDEFLQSVGLYDEISPDQFVFLSSASEQQALFDELKQLNYLRYNPNLNYWTVNYNSFPRPCW